MESWAKSTQGSKWSPKGMFLRLHGLGFCPKVSTFLKKLSPKLITTKTDSTTQNQSQHKMGMRTPNIRTTRIGLKGLKIYCLMYWAWEPRFLHSTDQAWSPWHSQSKPKALVYTKLAMKAKSLLKRLHGPFKPLGYKAHVQVLIKKEPR